MIKIAIFTEGQSELIFVRHFLFRIVDNAKLCIECLKLHGGREVEVPFSFSCPNPDLHFLIINVENDERVLSAIKEREQKLLKLGYDRIIGLRDMYSEAYDRRSYGAINDEITNEFINRYQLIINGMSEPDKIQIFLAIMELEAWFLSMYSLFAKINEVLSVEYIQNELSINLRKFDPQRDVYKPSNILSEIFELIGLKYDKSISACEMICSKMEISDFDDAIDNGRCKAFKDFYKEFKNISRQFQ